jgi:glycine/D-amino acid oxidase-like deaminating enzyme
LRPVRSGAIGRCLWTEQVARAPGAANAPPDEADVAVVGAGYTGLSAARTLARSGASVVVLEREEAGWGASGRNGGFVLPGFKPGVAELARRRGAATARALFARSVEALGFLEAVVAEERIACDYVRCGSVTLADRTSHLADLERERRALIEVAGHETRILDRTEIRTEIGSMRFPGGLLDPAAGSLHPAKYCAGLARAAERAGARLVEHTEVSGIRRGVGGFEVATSRGRIRAREVLVAANGYTGPPFHRLRRRVVPIGSHIVATAPLEPALAAKLIPGGRVLSDTRHLLHYFRLSPDRRLLFGGRASFTPIGTARCATLLGDAMRRVFPELAATPVDFAWSGNVCFTRDRMPHAGLLDGLHYALGYCGHGVAYSTWLGARVGERLAGGRELPDEDRLRAIPLYGGRPWFLPLVGAYYRFRDWIS